MNFFWCLCLLETNAYLISQSQRVSIDRQSCSLVMLINSIVTTGHAGSDSIEVSSVYDASGKAITLKSPIALSISKGPVHMLYSLKYVGDVNSKPREVVSSTSLMNCAADTSVLLNNKDCGSLYYANKRIPNSEGFCCSCSFDQLLGIGGHNRGELQCNLLTSLFQNGSSVHCLRFGPVWYSLFDIMTPAIDSTVTVTDKRGSRDKANSEVDDNTEEIGDHSSADDIAESAPLELSLSSSSPVVTGSIQAGESTLNVTARLVGSFEWTRAPTDWGLSKYAAAPNVPASFHAGNSDYRIKNSSPVDPFRYGLLLDRSAVDLSGDTCNKIGVSFSGFVNNQGSRCSARIGDCMGNQIDDLWQHVKPSDLINATLCDSLGGEFIPNDGYKLRCKLTEVTRDSPTQVLIEVNAANVQFVYNAAQGVITDVTVSVNSLDDNGVPRTTQSLKQDVFANISVQNVGDLVSEFLVNAGDCVPNTVTSPLGATTITIGPNVTRSALIKLEDSNPKGSEYNCTATLSDIDGYVLFTKEFEFNITKVIIDRGQQSSDGNTGYTNKTFSASAVKLYPDPCVSECVGFFSILCFFSNGCWTKIATFMGTLGGVSLMLFLLNKIGVVSGIVNLVKSMATACCSSSSSSQPEKEKKERPMRDHSPPYSEPQNIYQIDHHVYPPPMWYYPPSAPPPPEFMYSYQRN